MNYIVFTPEVGGHFLEYIHHEYVSFYNECDNLIIVVPKEFDKQKHIFEWEECSNITIDYLSEEECRHINSGPFIKASYWFCKIINDRCQKYQAEHVFCNLLIQALPLAPYLLKSNIRLSGIIYQIYLYRWKNSSRIQKILDVTKHYLMVKSKRFEHIFVLNDNASACYLNKLYNTSKYCFIPDPFNKLVLSADSKGRNDYSIKENDVVFLQFGALNKNKGTLKIFSSFDLVIEEKKHNYVFIFAGKVKDDIYEAFYDNINKYAGKIRVIVIDRFCDFNEIYNLCKISNALLLPYLRTSQSSGVIGYASQFGKPVIAPRKGLLGKLIKKYRLGIKLEDISGSSLFKAYNKVETLDYFTPSDSYCNTHTIYSFQQVFKNSFTL